MQNKDSVLERMQVSKEATTLLYFIMDTIKFKKQQIHSGRSRT